ncbi:MAG TPA: LUD domain-containing protein [Candidatus Dormibacteraeota bacterium]|nr:LUD domain-containing protein [Candidatus Dormibacteraeota bacterium]
MSTDTAEFTAPATAASLETIAERLRERNFETLIVDTAEQAHDEVMKRVPDGAEVHSAKSKTLEDIGVFKELMDSERHDFLRKKLFKMDRATQAREMRKLVSAPDFELGSVNAITEAGQMVVTSASGSQIGPYGGSAGNLILVVGSQKIVPDLDTAIRRINDHVFPYEDARLREQMGVGTKVARILILERDYVPGRTTVILVREPVGV